MSGYSYQVGSGSLLDGLDEALIGMSAGETSTFNAELVGGEHGGEHADVTVTVHSVKVKELPELDDEFAQSASEYDTLGEFRAGTRAQLEAMKRMQQVGQARERALDSVLAKIDIPLPDSMVTSETEMRRESLDEQLERAGTTMDAYLESSGQTAEQVETDMEDSARRSVKAGFVLDQLARQEELGIEQDELNSFVIEQAYRMGVQPDRLAQELADRGQIGSVITEVLRGKALTLITERATVTDEAGQPVDVSAPLQQDETDETGEAAGAEAGPAGSDEAQDSPADASAPDGQCRRGRCRRSRCRGGQCSGGQCRRGQCPEGQDPQAPGPEGQGGRSQRRCRGGSLSQRRTGRQHRVTRPGGAAGAVAARGPGAGRGRV